jgi:hypothetical protein
MLMAEMAGVPLPPDMPTGWSAAARSAGCPDPASEWLGEPDLSHLAASDHSVMPQVARAVEATVAASPLLRGTPGA